MASSKVSPLPFNVPIADPETGNPSPFFARQLRQLLDEAIATAVATAAAQAAADAAQATADNAVPQTRLINTAGPITGGGDLTADLNLGHAASSVVAGSYTSADITVDADGHVTAAANGGGGGGGTAWSSITGTPTTLSGYGITDAAPLSHVGSGGVSQHALAVASGAAGFLSGSDKSKLDGLGTASTLDFDVDTTLSANSNSLIATQRATKAYIDAAVVGLLDLRGSQDCSANPNYPAAVKGDAYYVSVAGKIGGSSGKLVDIGDVFIASANNAGGTEASVGTSWFVLEHNLTGALVAANNLSDLTNTATARTNLGLAYFATGTDAANLTGTVAAGRFPAMTGGDVTSSAGSVNLTIGANVVTYAKFQQVAASSLVGNPTGSLANASGVTLGTGLAFSGTTVTVTAISKRTVFSTAGAATWTKDTRAKVVRVYVYGAGGSGGSGAAITSGTASSGGGGGGGGSMVVADFDASILATGGGTETLSIGTGGAAVNGVTGNNPGSNGNAGGNSTFGTWLTGYGGGRGGGGQSAAAAGGGGGAGLGGAGGGATGSTVGGNGIGGGQTGSTTTNTVTGGGGGGAGGVSGAGGASAGVVLYGGAAGAAGGGLAGVPANTTGGVGGTSRPNNTAIAGASTAGGAGNTPATASIDYAGGHGGGGGGGSAAGTGGAGGAGQQPSGGGGGGGSAISTQTSGASGKGGDGMIVVEEFF